MAEFDIADFFKKNKDHAVIVCVVILSLFVTRGVYMKEVGKGIQLTEKINTEKEKMETLDRIVVINEKLKKFKSKSWEKTDANAIIEKIYNIGLDSGIKLKDISPGAKIDEKHYILIPFSLSCEGVYQDFMKFVKILETYPSFLRVKKVAISPIDDGAAQDNAGMKLTIALSVEAVYFK